MHKPNETQRAIFIGGMPKSGKSLLGKYLDRHPEIAFTDSRAKLVGDRIFNHFPAWVIQCSPERRGYLVELLKKLCRTRFYCYHRDKYVRDSWLKFWQKVDRRWQARFVNPDHLFWRCPLGGLWDRIWLTAPVQSREFFLKPRPGIKAKAAGLRVRFDKQTVEDSLFLLDSIKKVRTTEEVKRIFGTWWCHLYDGYARQRGKTYWIDERPSYLIYAGFLRSCFKNLKIVHMVRDLRELSYVKYAELCRLHQRKGLDTNNPGEPGSLQSIVDEQAGYLRKSLDVQSKIPREIYLTVRYEDLIREREATLRRIFEFIQIDFDERVLSGVYQERLVERMDPGFLGKINDYATKHYGNLILK